MHFEKAFVTIFKAIERFIYDFFRQSNNQKSVILIEIIYACPTPLMYIKDVASSTNNI